MAQRRHHCEAAFEHYLRDRRVPYVAVDEARKALLPDRVRLAAGPATDGVRGLKSFDFVLYGSGVNLLIEIKGRRIARRPSPNSRGRLESWVTQDDAESLATWERLFGDGFGAAFVFLYWCDHMPPASLFEETFEFRGRWYAVRAVRLGDYMRAMKPRSARWRTVHLSTADFDRVSTTLCGRDSALPGPAEPVASSVL